MTLTKSVSNRRSVQRPCLPLALWLSASLLAAACGQGPPSPPTATTVPATLAGPTPTASAPVAGLAPVDYFDILALESFPVQIRLTIYGNLPDACTQIDSATQSREANTFIVRLATTRPGDAACPAVLTPYTHDLALDVQGLPKGTYTVEVNGVTSQFTLDVDNVFGSDAGSIGGQVWDDQCLPGGAGQPAPTQPPPGCAAQTDGAFIANGSLDPGEPGLGGVLVFLGQGACQAVDLASATTSADGRYSFTGLQAGDYCVSINPLREPNKGLLLPGIFTFPALEQGSVSLTLGPAENRTNVNFGWDFQLR